MWLIECFIVNAIDFKVIFTYKSRYIIYLEKIIIFNVIHNKKAIDFNVKLMVCKNYFLAFFMRGNIDVYKF